MKLLILAVVLLAAAFAHAESVKIDENDKKTEKRGIYSSSYASPGLGYDSLYTSGYLAPGGLGLNRNYAGHGAGLGGYNSGLGYPSSLGYPSLGYPSSLGGYSSGLGSGLGAGLGGAGLGSGYGYNSLLGYNNPLAYSGLGSSSLLGYGGLGGAGAYTNGYNNYGYNNHHGGLGGYPSRVLGLTPTAANGGYLY